MGADAGGERPGRPWVLRVLLAAALLLPLVPVALVAVPPLVDYPNHRARLWLIAGGAHDAPMSAIYAVDWSQAVTNIGIDLVALVLGPLIGAEAVSRGGVALSLLLPALGAVLLARAVAGRWHVLQVALPLATWNVCTTLGFLNHQIAIGLAMLAAAAEPLLLQRAVPVATLLRAAIGLAITVVHPFGMAAYAGLVGAWALGEEEGWRTQWSRAAIRVGSVVLPALLFLLLAPATPGAEQAASAVDRPSWLSWTTKVGTFTSPFVTHRPILEGAVGLLALLALAALAVAGAVRAHPGFLLAGCALAAVALFGPANVGDTGLIDVRVACLALPVLCIALRPADAGRRIWTVVGAVLCLLVVLRSTSVTKLWVGKDEEVASVRAALADVPEGTALLPVRILPQSVSWTDPAHTLLAYKAHFNIALLAVPERRVFVPMLFSGAGKQPIRVLAPWNEIAVPDGAPPTVQELVDPPAQPAPHLPYLRDWRRRFDHVLLLNAQALGPGMPPGLTLVRDAGFAQLWRIDRTEPSGRPSTREDMSEGCRPSGRYSPASSGTSTLPCSSMRAVTRSSASP